MSKQEMPAEFSCGNCLESDHMKTDKKMRG
jgi:hypothetical protein